MHLLISKVATLVVKHIPLRAKALTAVLRARKRLLICMDSLVDLEVLSLTEGLAAAWM